MSSSGEWGSNDYSNLITITASAIASVLLVLFKSRCSKISICFGLLSCDRKVIEDDEEKQKKPLKTQKSSQQAEPEPQADLY